MRNSAIAVCLMALCSATVFAQNSARSFVHTREKSAIRVPAPDAPEGLTKIFGNLGPKTAAYDPLNGWFVGGPNSGLDEFMGLAFTPKANAHVKQVQVAITYYSGDDQVNLSIYSDAGGVPDTLIDGPVTVTNLPANGACCALAIANFPSGVAVVALTQYWVVADTPLSGTGADFLGVWEQVVKPQPFAFGNGVWSPAAVPAGAVYGTVP